MRGDEFMMEYERDATRIQFVWKSRSRTPLLRVWFRGEPQHRRDKVVRALEVLDASEWPAFMQPVLDRHFSNATNSELQERLYHEH